MYTNGKLQLYPFLRLSLFLIAGILLGSLFNGMISPWIWLLLFAVAVFLSFSHSFLHFGTGCENAISNTLFVFSATLLLGAYGESIEYNNSRVQLPHEMNVYSGVVLSQPVCHGKVFQMDMIITDGSLAGRKIKASVLSGSVCNLEIGDGVEFYGRLETPKNYDSSFDYKLFLMHHGYIAQTFITEDNYTKCCLKLNQLSVLSRCVIRLRKLRGDIIGKYLSSGDNNHDATEVIAAIALGDKTGLTKELQNNYSISGASHVLALSGLHLGIIYAFLLFLMGKRIKWWKELTVLSVIWTFVFLVGCSQSVVRSAIMITIYGMVSLMKRNRMSLNTWAMALFFILICNPWSLYDVGMQMSFMAVLSILVYNRPLMHLLPVKTKVTKILWGTVCVSLSAQIGVAPLVAFYFHRFSTLFIMTNFVVIPLTTIILYVVICLFAFSFSPVIHDILLDVVCRLSSWMNKFVGWEAHLNCSSVENINLSVLQVMGIYLLIISLTWLLLLKPKSVTKNLYQ